MKSNKNEIALYFMPHCEKELYIKVCTNNQENLKDLCIIGNSFNSYIEKADLVGKQHNPEIQALKVYYCNGVIKVRNLLMKSIRNWNCQITRKDTSLSIIHF
jgi:hypothetical protein